MLTANIQHAATQTFFSSLRCSSPKLLPLHDPPPLVSRRELFSLQLSLLLHDPLDRAETNGYNPATDGQAQPSHE